MILNINNQEMEVADSLGDQRLVDFLREDLGLTGAKNACDIGACGACTILLDDEPLKICMKKLNQVVGHKVLTIEGMAAPDGTLHPLQAAFMEHGAIQCGFCTPGMVMTAHAYLLKNPTPTRDQIRKAINGNLCRCTGYQQIIDAIYHAASHYQAKETVTEQLVAA
jgi:carbon-monoxide dehydrogenase small subunit